MTNAEQLIAKLIDEGKITGQEAIILINACKQDVPKSNLDGHRPWTTVMYDHSNQLHSNNLSSTNYSRGPVEVY